MNPPPPQSLFQTYLLPGERVLWTGKPKQGIAFRPADTFLIPFSLLWGGFALFWNIGVWTFSDVGERSVGEPDLYFRLFGLPFLIFGIYLIVGRFLHDAAIRRNIAYAITDQRVLALRSSRSPKLTSFDIGRLPMLELSEHSDGTGTISFDTNSEPSLFSRQNGMDWWVPSLFAPKKFFQIDNPRHVYQLIQRQSARG